MQSTGKPLLTVSIAETEWFNGEWRIKDEELRSRIHRLLIDAYKGAIPSFNRDRLEFYPTANTVVFVGRMNGEPVSTAALKTATDLAELDRLLETDIRELEELMVDHALQEMLDTKVRDLEPIQRRLDTIVDRRAQDRLLVARRDTLDGLGAKVPYPIAVFARAGNAPGHRGLNQSMRLCMLEYAWRAGLKAQAGLNAEASGLPGRLEKLGYWTFPVTRARKIFGGPQRVTWLTRGEFKRVAGKLRRAQIDGKIPATRWDDAVSQALSFMDCEPW